MLRTQLIGLPDDLGVSDGVLIFDGEVLLAVLGRLSDDMYDSHRGLWHVEATFTRRLASGELFRDLNTAMDRISASLDRLAFEVSVSQPTD
jgi:hypothetical protein